MGLGLWDLGVRVQGFWLKVEGFSEGFGGSGFRTVGGLGFRWLGFRDLGFKVKDSGNSGIQILGV